jgi:hypothetical protein
MLDIKLPKDLKVVRVFPKNKLNLNDDIDLCILGYVKNNKIDDFITQDILDKRVLKNLINITKCKAQDILNITQNGLEKVLN